jgi:hypothetical protein
MTAISIIPSERSRPCVHFPSPKVLATEWDGLCLELVNHLLNEHPEGDILYVENLPFDHVWKYHAALVLDGLVYDAWHPDVRLPPTEYVAAVFGSGATWEINPGADEERST